MTDPGVGESLDRARVYRALAALFRRPDPSTVKALWSHLLPEARAALERLGAPEDCATEAASLQKALSSMPPDELQGEWDHRFEPSAADRCVPNETAHTCTTPAHALAANHRLADIAGFYRAFGLAVAPGGELPDHLAVELEFLQCLAVKEALAREREGYGEHAETCRSASCSFLREHLALWVPRFAEPLERSGGTYRAAARLLAAFVAFDAERLGATAVVRGGVP